MLWCGSLHTSGVAPGWRQFSGPGLGSSPSLNDVDMSFIQRQRRRKAGNGARKAQRERVVGNVDIAPAKPH